MKINQKYVSFYYQGMTEVPDMQLERSKTALLIIDMQKEFVNRDCGDYLKAKEAGDEERWIPYHDRLDQVVIPNTKRLIQFSGKRHGGYIRADCLPEGERKGQSQSAEHLWLE